MTSHRFSFKLLTLPLVFAAVLAVAPAGALAGTLLSGYGSPGGGAQALLGSALINGAPPGGSGSSGGGSSGGGGSATGSGVGSAAGAGQAGQGHGQSQGAGQSAGEGSSALGAYPSGAHGNGAQGTKSAAGASAGGSSAYTSSGSPQPVAGAVAAEDAGPLGLTGAGLLLLGLVLGVLALTAGLTTRLARTQH
jgi:hypothetical protein